MHTGGMSEWFNGSLSDCGVKIQSSVLMLEVVFITALDMVYTPLLLCLG